MTGEGIALAHGSEQDLQSRLAQSDPAAFDQLVALHAPGVRRLAYRLLGWREDAEDVVQDVFLAAFKQVRRFRRNSSIGTWLTTITINRCRTHRRRQLLRMRWLTRRAKLSDAPAADGASMDQEVVARVRSAVRALRAQDREVIVLFYLEDQTAAQISEVLGISRGAVELRLHRARARLKKTLSDFVSD
jgi:RNA polymerase sigma factor (sigma-70 family)